MSNNTPTNTLGKLTGAILWPGTKIVERMGIDPESDNGLLRSMFNMLIWATSGLFLVWAIMA